MSEKPPKPKKSLSEGGSSYVPKVFESIGFDEPASEAVSASSEQSEALSVPEPQTETLPQPEPQPIAAGTSTEGMSFSSEATLSSIRSQKAFEGVEIMQDVVAKLKEKTAHSFDNQIQAKKDAIKALEASTDLSPEARADQVREQKYELYLLEKQQRDFKNAPPEPAFNPESIKISNVKADLRYTAKTFEQAKQASEPAAQGRSASVSQPRPVAASASAQTARPAASSRPSRASKKPSLLDRLKGFSLGIGALAGAADVAYATPVHNPDVNSGRNHNAEASQALGRRIGTGGAEALARHEVHAPVAHAEAVIVKNEGPDAFFLDIRKQLREQFPDATAATRPLIAAYLLNPKNSQDLAHALGFTSKDGKESRVMQIGEKITVTDTQVIFHAHNGKDTILLQIIPGKNGQPPVVALKRMDDRLIPTGHHHHETHHHEARVPRQPQSPEHPAVSAESAAPSTPAAPQHPAPPASAPTAPAAPLQNTSGASPASAPETLQAAPPTEYEQQQSSHTLTDFTKMPGYDQIRNIVASDVANSPPDSGQAGEVALQAKMQELIRNSGMTPKPGQSVEQYVNDVAQAQHGAVQ